MNSIALIVKRDSQCYELHYCAGSQQILSIHDDLLEKIAYDTNWLGFYDWLRTSDGEIIGLRIKLDDAHNRNYSNLIQSFFSGCTSINDVNYIFFKDSKDFDENLSDDADFCDLAIYRSLGTLGIAFNKPALRVTVKGNQDRS
jgi:hypothetical protein